MIKERPIIFSGPMVKAILEGRKTMTRRPCKGQRELSNIHDFRLDGCPYGITGNRLWVRETWCCDNPASAQDAMSPGYGIFYKATEVSPDIYKWKPSIFMPRWASRITLEIMGVKIERVQDISGEDAIKEGIGAGFQMNAGWPDYQHIKNGVCELTQDTVRMSFASLWDSIYKPPYSWTDNPWVWAIEFRRIEP